MPAPTNTFKAALKASDAVQLGIWLSLASEGNAEVLAGAGADFVVVDGEHAPNDLDLVRRQLTAAQGARNLLARPPVNETWMIKQFMDAGAQTLIVPMVDTPEQAEAAARAMRFPPEGNRGVAGASRAAGYGRTSEYLTTANDQACCIVQIESPEAVANLEAIAAVPGVDGLFIGPADLSATHGHLGRITSPEMEHLIRETLGRINATGKASAILSFDPATAMRYADWGAKAVVVASDTSLLTRGAKDLLAGFR